MLRNDPPCGYGALLSAILGGEIIEEEHSLAKVEFKQFRISERLPVQPGGVVRQCLLCHRSASEVRPGPGAPLLDPNDGSSTTSTLRPVGHRTIEGSAVRFTAGSTHLPLLHRAPYRAATLCRVATAHVRQATLCCRAIQSTSLVPTSGASGSVDQRHQVAGLAQHAGGFGADELDAPAISTGACGVSSARSHDHRFGNGEREREQAGCEKRRVGAPLLPAGELDRARPGFPPPEVTMGRSMTGRGMAASSTLRTASPCRRWCRCAASVTPRRRPPRRPPATGLLRLAARRPERPRRPCPLTGRRGLARPAARRRTPESGSTTNLSRCSTSAFVHRSAPVSGVDAVSSGTKSVLNDLGLARSHRPL